MKVIRIIALAAAAAGFVTLGACKSNNSGSSYTPPPAQTGGTYIDSGK
jgi:hypothetical protein